MLRYEDLWDINPFSLKKEEKKLIFSERLSALSKIHYNGCLPYKKIIDGFQFQLDLENSPEEFPFLPVRLFKQYELRSVDLDSVIKTMTSSGTTGQKVSKIFLDKVTASAQVKALTKIMSHFLGPQRLPMLIIDKSSILKDRRYFSARGAGILGFSILGRDITYALNEKMELDYNSIHPFLEKHKGEKILLFGFTSIIWEHFYLALKKNPQLISLEQATLIHGGGWKKLIAQSVSNDTFKASLAGVCGIKKIYNYYGMVEQTGSIFTEGDCGHLHCSVFSDVIMRRPDFSPCCNGEKGLVELISLLPTSYPGHVLLSEDLGELLGEDNCSCGLLGKYFKIHGRVENAEIRGCSDTYQSI
ncbi:MAG: acyl-protein synthetase [Candidatus Poribacteria bacterium]